MTSMMWNNGFFEVLCTSGTSQCVQVIGGDVDNRNGARHLRQSYREEESRVQQRMRVGGKG
jgi:hypothetical protein